MVDKVNKKLSQRQVLKEDVEEYINRELAPLVERLRLLTDQLLDRLTEGEGSPEGVMLADKAALYLQQDGVPGSLLWVKTTDGVTTGWLAVA